MLNSDLCLWIFQRQIFVLWNSLLVSKLILNTEHISVASEMLDLLRSTVCNEMISGWKAACWKSEIFVSQHEAQLLLLRLYSSCTGTAARHILLNQSCSSRALETYYSPPQNGSLQKYQPSCAAVVVARIPELNPMQLSRTTLPCPWLDASQSKGLKPLNNISWQQFAFN